MSKKTEDNMDLEANFQTQLLEQEIIGEGNFNFPKQNCLFIVIIISRRLL